MRPWLNAGRILFLPPALVEGVGTAAVFLSAPVNQRAAVSAGAGL